MDSSCIRHMKFCRDRTLNMMKINLDFYKEIYDRLSGGQCGALLPYISLKKKNMNFLAKYIYEPCFSSNSFCFGGTMPRPTVMKDFFSTCGYSFPA